MHATLLSFLLAFSFLAPAPVQDAPQREKRPALAHYNLSKDGLAIEGYDPVAYFPEGGGSPRKGDPGIATMHAGVTYHFASEANREAFLESPARFEPAYGGWCAYAMADGEKVEVDVESFLVQGGRLYLFYKGLFNDTRKKWSKHPDELQKDADVHWERISGEDPARVRPTQEPRDVSKLDLGKDGLALEGYDPVGYFAAGGRPVPGSPERVAVWRGAVYRFASDANRAAFRAEPERYEPAYGGWCAYAMSDGKRVDPDPEAFLIQDGRLLVFYRKRKTDTREKWAEDPAGLARKADAHWAELAR